MQSLSLRLRTSCALVVLTVLALAGCGSTLSTRVAASPTPVLSKITIQQGQSFAPFILPIEPGTAVTFANNDTKSHTVKSTPAKDPLFLNLDPIDLTIPAGGTQSQTFTKPGLYDYFDDTMGTWNTDDNRVQANDKIATFPLAYEGIIWVQGPIAGLPTTAMNSVISGKDDFEKDFVAISRGGTVGWHNNDTDKHYVQTATGWGAPINPVAIPLITVRGIADAPPIGQTQTYTFGTPGLYYYYCTAHADVDQATHRIKAHDNASESPIPMEGFVLVD